MKLFCLQCGNILDPMQNLDNQTRSFLCSNCGFVVNIRPAPEPEEKHPDYSFLAPDADDDDSESSIKTCDYVPPVKQPNFTPTIHKKQKLNDKFDLVDFKYMLVEALRHDIDVFEGTNMTYAEYISNAQDSTYKLIKMVNAEFNFRLKPTFFGIT